ncbi:MAG: ABC transporter ATP-binding protein [Clostridiales bacterium]|nr:ABC transporter ATP-binding protein [Clostridiales bacterium]
MKRYWERIKKLYGKRDIAYASMVWLLSQAAPYKKQLLIKLAISSIALGMSFVSTIAGKYIVDATTSGSLNWIYITYMAGASLFTILFSAGTNIFSSYLNEKFEFGMRCDMFNQVQRSIWSELSKFHSGDIVTRLTSDVANISSGLISIIPSTITLGIRLLISFCILLYFDPWLALFALIIAPIGAISALLYRRKYRYYQIRLRESESTYRSFMQENMANIAVIKTFQQEDENNAYLKKIRNERMDLVMRSAKLSALMSSFMSIIYRSGYVIAFCWSAYRISQGKITYGTMTVFLSLVSQVQGSISSLGAIIPQIYRMLVSAKRITDIVDIRDEDYVDIKTQPNNVTVELKDVTFAYDKQIILNHVNLTVKPGEIIGVVGPSGVGKTTLTRLLLSLVKPNKGHVEYIDESQNREEAQPASRRFISYVPQGNTLLSGTIEMNLRTGKTNATEEELWEALRLADAERFVKKTKNGLKTHLSEKAGGLSEGQAQRIAIARALLRNKPLLILDEATSALDEDTESRILAGISNNYGRTVFIITHRRSMLKYCDRVIEINENAEVNISNLSKDAS